VNRNRYRGIRPPLHVGLTFLNRGATRCSPKLAKLYARSSPLDCKFLQVINRTHANDPIVPVAYGHASDQRVTVTGLPPLGSSGVIAVLVTPRYFFQLCVYEQCAAHNLTAK
jgi:hypothetical protein